LKGRYHHHKWTPEGVAKSKDYYEQAIAADPTYASAWYGLAYFYFTLGISGSIPPKAANAHALQAAQKALELDDTLAEAHSMMGLLRAAEYDWTGAERAFRRALDLNAESSEVWMNYINHYLVPMRRLDEAIAAGRSALELDPLSPYLHERLGYWNYIARRWDRAIEECRTALELDPHFYLAHATLDLAYFRQARPARHLR